MIRIGQIRKWRDEVGNFFIVEGITSTSILIRWLETGDSDWFAINILLEHTELMPYSE